MAGQRTGRHCFFQGQVCRERPAGEEQAGHYHTLGGLLLTVFDRIPHTGEMVWVQNIRLEVIDMDGNRIDKVLVRKRRPSVQGSPEEQSLYLD